MTLYDPTILALAVWVPVRHWSQRRSGPLPDVPDAPRTAEPLEAPGLTPPYRGLDPFAPPKQLAHRTGADGASESDQGSRSSASVMLG